MKTEGRRQPPEAAMIPVVQKLPYIHKITVAVKILIITARPRPTKTATMLTVT